MMALDTNVLIRFLVKDDAQQAQVVYQRFKQAEINQAVLFVPLLVVLESIWVLQSVYAIADETIVSALNELMQMPVLSFEAPAVIQDFITSGRAIEFDLSDILIAHSARFSNCKGVYTFDKKAARFKYFEYLTVNP
ncbi:MAG: PIN domain-containing protein [Nitrosomonas sp.]|nr:PIN domain-containing protein [Nitrosomonas sp.]